MGVGVTLWLARVVWYPYGNWGTTGLFLWNMRVGVNGCLKQGVGFSWALLRLPVLMFNMFRMLIHLSSGACDLFVELFHGLYWSGLMCVGVTLWFGCGGVVSVCRLKHYWPILLECGGWELMVVWNRGLVSPGLCSGYRVFSVVKAVRAWHLVELQLTAHIFLHGLEKTILIFHDVFYSKRKHKMFQVRSLTAFRVTSRSNRLQLAWSSR